MTHKDNFHKAWAIPMLLFAVLVALILALVGSHPASALNPIPPPDPKPGSYGLEATKPQPPPKTGARITVPSNGAAFSSSPITVSGICPDGLLVQIYNNDVMVGSVMCERGSFRLIVSLFVGQNELKALVYDDLDQAGPASNIVRVTYNNTSFRAFGELITLTSSYGRRAASTGTQLVWPLQLSGGTGPYAFSIDWGDGSEAELMSQALAGVVNIRHIYKRAGIYRVNVRVTDANGATAFLQLIAVSNGEVAPGDVKPEDEGPTERVIILWIPAAVALALLFPAYWLGRRSQLVSLRNKMLKERDSIQKNQ